MSWLSFSSGPGTLLTPSHVLAHEILPATLCSGTYDCPVLLLEKRKHRKVVGAESGVKRRWSVSCRAPAFPFSLLCCFVWPESTVPVLSIRQLLLSSVPLKIAPPTFETLFLFWFTNLWKWMKRYSKCVLAICISCFVHCLFLFLSCY